MKLFDTHAHLDDDQFEQDLDDVVARARLAGVPSIVAVATTARSSLACVRIASRYEGVYASAGIHPNCCARAEPSDWDHVVSLAGTPRVVGLGETGLDRYWDDAPFPIQQDFFDRHLQLSQQRDLPFVVHMRDCAEDVLTMLRQAHRRGPLRGVMHSFTGDSSVAAECIELGLMISFAGMVTYKKSATLRETAAGIPNDRLLIETDSPYLSPHPHRGQRPNEPALLVHTAACLAEVRHTTIEKLARCTSDNAKRFFRVERR